MSVPCACACAHACVHMRACTCTCVFVCVCLCLRVCPLWCLYLYVDRYEGALEWFSNYISYAKSNGDYAGERDAFVNLAHVVCVRESESA